MGGAVLLGSIHAPRRVAVIFSLGQASRPALGQVAKRRSQALLPQTTVRRGSSFRLTGGSGRLSDPQPSFRQVTARSARQYLFHRHCQIDPTQFRLDQGAFVTDGGHIDLGNKASACIVSVHLRFSPPIYLHPIDTGGNIENVTVLRRIVLTLSVLTPRVCCWDSLVLQRVGC
jgi:hypothetical protein